LAARIKGGNKMAKRNYSQYANKNNTNKVTEEELNPIEAAVEQIVVEPVEETVVVEPVVEATPDVPVTGVVANCTKLNVREKPAATADVLCVLEAATKIEIDAARSTGDWYHVTTATGVEGYCMKKFVEANL
jgi:uncharacterized protein YgiM (DUF1202 family)